MSLIFGRLLTSCNSASTPSTENTNASVTLPSKTPSTNQVENIKDTIQYDSYIFPDDSTYIGKLLSTGVFHEDEVWPTAEKENWVGLFKNGNEYYVSKTKIKLTKVHDPIVDEDTINDKTGWNVQALHIDTALFFFAGLDLPQTQKTKHLNFDKREIFPGDTVSFKFLGHSYKLYATGGKKKTANDPLWYEVWNYKLTLESDKNGKIINDLLVAQPQFNDAIIYLIFAGDIDGDGFLDLIIDTSSHYNAASPTLYLSKPADNGHLLKVVGQHISVGC